MWRTGRGVRMLLHVINVLLVGLIVMMGTATTIGRWGSSHLKLKQIFKLYNTLLGGVQSSH